MKERLADHLEKIGYIRDERVKRSFLTVPRDEFLPPELRKANLAYVDNPLPLFDTGQTISAPHMCALILGYLEPLTEGMNIFEIGSGSGYQAALLAEMVAPTEGSKKKAGHVYTKEIVSELVPFARENLQRAGYADRVTVIEGDGTLGFPEKSPYDRIVLTAAGPKVPPPLIDQLKVGGKLCMPKGRRLWQKMILITKQEDGKQKTKNLGSVAFVPLRGEHGI